MKDYDTELATLRVRHDNAHLILSELRTEIQMLRNQTDRYLNIIDKLNIKIDWSLKENAVSEIALKSQEVCNLPSKICKYEQLLTLSVSGRILIRRIKDSYKVELWNGHDKIKEAEGCTILQALENL